MVGIISIRPHSVKGIGAIRGELKSYDRFKGLTKAERDSIVNQMVNYQAQTLNATFSALAHPARRAILERLVSGESSVLELARPFDMSLPAITKHLRVLEEAGLVTSHKVGRVRQCRLAGAPLKDAAAWLAFYQRFWETRMDSLSEYLDETKSLVEEIDDKPHT